MDESNGLPSFRLDAGSIEVEGDRDEAVTQLRSRIDELNEALDAIAEDNPQYRLVRWERRVLLEAVSELRDDPEDVRERAAKRRTGSEEEEDDE